MAVSPRRDDGLELPVDLTAMSLVDRPGELTAAWTAAVLSRADLPDVPAVEAVDVEPIGEQGQTGLVVRVKPRYAGGPSGDAPTSLIVKLPPADAAVREHMRAIGMYQREVSFYRDIAEPGIPVPRCYAAELDDETGNFVLVLEDMADCRVGEIWSGAPVEDLETAIDALAPFHARWWCSPELRSVPWLTQHDDMGYYQELSSAAYRMTLPTVRERHPSHFSDTYLGRVARLLDERWEPWAAYRDGDPFALVHSDFHPKQMFFPTEAGGRFAAFDWQTVAAGPPAMDVSRLLLKGLRPAALRAHQQALVDRYHAGLTAAGVDVDSGWLDREVRSRMLVTLYITVFVLASTDLTALESAAEARGVDFLGRFLGDLGESLEDNRAHEILEALA